MAGILSKNIKFEYAEITSGTVGSYTEVSNLLQIPAMGAKKDDVDVTTLADANYRNIPGLKNFGELSFTFLYDPTASTGNFSVLSGLSEDTVYSFRVTFPGTPKKTFTFDGYGSTEVQGAGVNQRLEFNYNIKLQSDITIGTAT